MGEDHRQLSFGTKFEAEVGALNLGRQEVALPPPPGAAAPYAIRALRLRNFKGFREFEVSFGRFNVLVGANNSGKSSLLRAIRFAYELTKMHFARGRGGHAEFYRGRSVPKPLLPVAQLRDLWPAGRMRAGNTWIPSEISMELSSGHTLSFGIIGPWNAATSRIGAEFKTMNAIPYEVLQGFLAHPPEFVPASIGIVAEEEYRTPARRFALVATGRHNEIVRNYLSDLSEPQFNELSELLEKYFGAKVEVPLFDVEKDQFISAVYTSDEAEHDLFSAGGGFLQIVEVLAFILRGSPGVILLDEPDSHLHSALQHALVDILEGMATSRGFQVIMATHSKEIINYVDPSRLIPVDRKGTATAPLQSHATTVTLLKELGALDNIDAYQIVIQKSLLIVEGPTDRELIPRLAARAGATLFEGASRVSIVPAKGVDRLSDDAELSIIEELLGQGVRSLRLRDRDGLTESWATQIVSKSKRPMFMWPRDCLENYLIVPAAIYRVLVKELGEGKAPTLQEIDTIISKAVDDLRDATFDRIAARLQDVEWRLGSRRINAAEANPIARKELDRIWGQEGGGLVIVSGKEVLKKVRSAIQDRWKVSFGNARIVEEMEPEDIHGDIRKFLEQAARVLVAPTRGLLLA